MRRIILLAFLCLAFNSEAIMKSDFGKTPEGVAVDQYTLTNGNGLQAKIMTYGATWTHMLTPDRDGKMGDILLGFDTLEPYLKGHPYFGSTVGRVGNRIAKGQFWLNGKKYQLAINNGPNHLHGGLKAFDKMVWKAMPTEDGVAFSLHDPDGSNGYPGNLDVTVIYTLTDDDELRIEYMATSDAPTPLNLTNHAYFNLGTPASGTVEDHVVQLFADHYTPVDDTLIPTGRIAAVRETPYDFRKPRPIGSTDYDHNWVLRGPTDDFKPVARVWDPQSGRVLEIFSDQPGVQFYTGNFLDGTLTGKDGVAYPRHGAFCLETQHFPDSVNHANFPSVILEPGEVYRTVTVHRFSTR